MIVKGIDDEIEERNERSRMESKGWADGWIDGGVDESGEEPWKCVMGWEEESSASPGLSSKLELWMSKSSTTIPSACSRGGEQNRNSLRHRRTKMNLVWIAGWGGKVTFGRMNVQNVGSEVD